MKIYQCLTMMLFAMLATTSIYANDIPSDNSDVAIEFIIEPASVLKITFDDAVTLHSIIIKNSDGYLLNLDVQVPKNPATVFYFEIPKLPPAEYLVMWRSQNDDALIRLGEAKLTLKDDVYPRPSTKKPKYGILHRKLNH
ncbi:copper resistance protein CopC [Shewanella sp. MEBiC00475]|uniref:copper resistance protein CopC n=1 Tax=Shewanella sp. MEBiC00475 TaxID=2575361 RepID=UPI0010BF9FAA|nr:copper resistance protein CopC [Shewanella sp. MEBiC00475]